MLKCEALNCEKEALAMPLIHEGKKACLFCEDHWSKFIKGICSECGKEITEDQDKECFKMNVVCHGCFMEHER